MDARLTGRMDGLTGRMDALEAEMRRGFADLQWAHEHGQHKVVLDLAAALRQAW